MSEESVRTQNGFDSLLLSLFILQSERARDQKLLGGNQLPPIGARGPELTPRRRRPPISCCSAGLCLQLACQPAAFRSPGWLAGRSWCWQPRRRCCCCICLSAAGCAGSSAARSA